MNGRCAFISSESIITQCAFNTVYAHIHCITVKRQTKKINWELLAHHLAARENLSSWGLLLIGFCLAVNRTLAWTCLNVSHVEEEAGSFMAINKTIWCGDVLFCTHTFSSMCSELIRQRREKKEGICASLCMNINIFNIMNNTDETYRG